MTRKMSRRRFLKISAAVTAATAISGVSCFSSDFDIIIVGGTIFDGSGTAGFPGDIGIRGGKIVAIGDLKDRSAARKIDAAGLVVAPGFIDFHSHSDDELLLGGEAQSKIRQGVTLEVLGQDGGSYAPLNEKMREQMRKRMRNRYDIEIDWTDFQSYFLTLEQRGMICNALSMLGQGTLRECVVGEDDRPATDAEIAEMKRLAAQAFEQGAYGISSGLEYVPGSFASTAEIIEVCKAMNGRGIYSTHMRNEDDTLIEAVQEAIEIARGAGVDLNVSHLKASGRRNWDKLPEVLALLDETRAGGMRVTCDGYPYVAYNTGLASMFPLWSRDGGSEKFVTRLQDPALTDSIRSAVLGKVEKIGGWQSVMISGVSKNPEREKYEGKQFQELTADGGDPFELLVNLVMQEEGGGSMVGFAMSEENTAKVLAYPHCMTASDGSALAESGVLSSGSPHPRAFGTFPRLLGKYVREEQRMPLEDAIRKITSLPAEMLRLTDRGLLKENYHADITIFDPATVTDNATFQHSQQYPSGIPFVLVNGVPVIDGDKFSGALPGKVVRS